MGLRERSCSNEDGCSIFDDGGYTLLDYFILVICVRNGG